MTKLHGHSQSARGNETGVRPARPFIQTAMRIGPANDPLEREADRVADAVVSNQVLSSGSVSRGSGIQRMCADCAEEEKDTVRLQREDEEEEILTKPADAGKPAPQTEAAQSAADAVSGGGVPMSPAARSYFEPRFNADFSGVRVHTHGRAQTASRKIGARAYTLGRDIAFADGQFDESSHRGRHLLAHELAHVVQQGKAAPSVIRRARYGTGTPPVFKGRTIAVVPQDERAHVDAAMALVDSTVDNIKEFSACHDHYAEHCPNGSDKTLREVWQRARIWRITDTDADELAKGRVGGIHMAYTTKGYEKSVDALAETLMHEAGHNCGIPGGDPHWHADQIAAYCIGSARNEISYSAGANVGPGSPIFLVSYRRFLGDWASGRLRLTLGADFNAVGAALEGADAAINTPAERRAPTGFGSAMVGAHVNLGGFGGPRYGGMSLRLETGLGAGRFRVPSAPRADNATTTLAPSWVLQIGPRAEFLVPLGPHALPLSVGAAYRLMQPLNGDAEALHGLMGTLEVRF